MIHSVAVLGAGAVGSYVIWGISSLDDVELGVIAEGERAAKGQAVFRYYGDNEEKLQQQIEKVNSKIQDAMSKEETIKQKK